MQVRRLLVAFTILAAGCGPREDAVRGVADVRENSGVRASMPSLVDIHGTVQQPFDDDNSPATVLVFTMQDCPIANSYIPTLNKLFDEYMPRGIRMLIVHVDPQLSLGDARKHAEEFQIKAPVVLDQQHAWVDRAGATKSPEVAVFSSGGDVLYSGRVDDRYAALGKRRTHVTTHDLRDALEAILAGRAVSRPKTDAVGCYIPPLPLGE
jgi:hypothetical protein